MARNTAKTQGRVVALGSIGRSGKIMLSWVYSLESKKESRGQSERESQKEEDCREEEEKENIGVLPTALRWDASKRCWEIPDHMI